MVKYAYFYEQNLKVLNTKSALRIEYRKRRDALTEDQIADWSIEISNRCLTLNLWEYSLYHLFITAEKKQGGRHLLPAFCSSRKRQTACCPQNGR